VGIYNFQRYSLILYKCDSEEITRCLNNYTEKQCLIERKLRYRFIEKIKIKNDNK